MKKSLPYRIAVLGPESTGKSVLAEKLAVHFNCQWVPEYSREYLEGLGRKYNYDDILAIARRQFEAEQQALKKTEGLLFCDTEFIVNKIWCDEKYGKCHPWIIDMISSHPYDLYLLCNTDLPWIPDPLRENPNDRKRLFGLYKHELESRKFDYAIISGLDDERLLNAIKAIKTLPISPLTD